MYVSLRFISVSPDISLPLTGHLELSVALRKTWSRVCGPIAHYPCVLEIPL